MDMTTFAAVGIVTAAGLVRGTTGFGGAMLMTPVLSALLGPIPAVVTALFLETAAALVMFPDALPKARWRTLLYLIFPAVVTVPLGGYFLLTVDPAVARKMISAVVIIFSLMLLLGFRYSGSPRVITSLALGSVVGALLGATSVGAPPGHSLFTFRSRSRSGHARQFDSLRDGYFGYRADYASGRRGDRWLTCCVSDVACGSILIGHLAWRSAFRAVE